MQKKRTNNINVAKQTTIHNCSSLGSSIVIFFWSFFGSFFVLFYLHRSARTRYFSVLVPVKLAWLDCLSPNPSIGPPGSNLRRIVLRLTKYHSSWFSNSGCNHLWNCWFHLPLAFCLCLHLISFWRTILHVSFCH